MEINFWEKNTKILNEQYPGLLEEILKREDDSHLTEGLKIETAATGAPTLAVKGLYAHSPRDPQREGKRLAQAAAADGECPGPVIILGFGLGYAAQAVAEMYPRRPVIIVEKNRNVLRKALELRDLSSLLSRPCVAFLPGGASSASVAGEGITATLALFEKSAGKKSAPYVMRNRTLTGLDEQWYALVESKIRSWAMRDDVNRATLKKFAARWTRNLSRNMSAIRDLPGISRLAGLAYIPKCLTQKRKGAGEEGEGEKYLEPLPVFLAAAGPSLDSVAPLLPEIHRRCIIVAVDTSLRFLLRNGIEPDFTLVIDPQFWNSCHLNRCVCEKTRLIAESSTYPSALRFPFRGIYLCGSLYPLGVFFEQRVDPKGSLGAGGSVATSAWDFARVLGARQIWIAGLDLAFPALKTHFRGAQFEEKALAESTRLNPAETWLVHALRDGIPFKAPAISGGEVLTDRRLSLYASWFESRFREFPILNYSLSSGGLAISGLEPAGAEDILALPAVREAINRRLEAAFSRIETEFFAPEETRKRGERYENALAALNSGLQKIQSACLKGKEIAELALRQSSGPAHALQTAREKNLAALDEINRFITSSEVKEIAGFLFPRETITEMGRAQAKDEDAAFHAYLKSCEQLYQSLAEAADFRGIEPGKLPENR